MTVETLKDGSFNILQISGEVDASNAIVLDENIDSLMSVGAEKILVDCSMMNYISSAGLGVFMSKIEDFKKKHIHFILFNVSGTIKNVFDILGLNEFIKIAESLTEAKKVVNDQTDER